ncbi:DUF1566 domain-containing protein [bacterium]|nr:DUF1566 domain-containing protein [bacterium]
MSLFSRLFRTDAPDLAETVLDQREGLMWQRNHEPLRMTHDEAYAYCKSLRLGNHSDWVLPSVGQFSRLRHSRRLSGAISRADADFWTSSPSDYSPLTAAFVSDGRCFDKTEKFYVRAVRHL